MATHQSVLTSTQTFSPLSEVATMRQTDGAAHKLKPRSFHKSAHLWVHSADFHPGVNRAWHRGTMSQTLFSLYLHNQSTDFHKLSCTEKPQMRAIRTYAGCTKATTNNWDIRPSVAVKALSANISWMAEQIRTIELALESAHQSIYNNIWCISKQ